MRLKNLGVIRVGIAILVASLTACDKAPTPPPPVAVAPAPVAAPAVVTAPVLTRPATQPGVIQPGDWLRCDIAELTAAGKVSVVYMRVASDGTAGLPLIGGIQVGGLTDADAETSVAKAYTAEHILMNAQITIDRIWLNPPGGKLPGPIAAGDLVRVSISDLTGNGMTTTVIHRVGIDGKLSLPLLPKIQVAGLTDSAACTAIAKGYFDHKIINNAIVTVITLEAAPADAAHLDLPDGPIDPVPDALKPLFAR